MIDFQHIPIPEQQALALFQFAHGDDRPEVINRARDAIRTAWDHGGDERLHVCLGIPPTNSQWRKFCRNRYLNMVATQAPAKYTTARAIAGYMLRTVPPYMEQYIPAWLQLKSVPSSATLFDLYLIMAYLASNDPYPTTLRQWQNIIQGAV